MPDRVGLSSRDAEVDAVGVLRRERVGHVALGSGARHPHRLRRVVGAGEHSALLEVGHRSGVVAARVEYRLDDGRRDPHVRSDVVVLERGRRGLPNVSVKPGLPLVHVVADRPADSSPGDGVLRAGGRKVVHHVARCACLALVDSVRRDGGDDVVVVGVERLRAELNEPVRRVRGECGRIDRNARVVCLDRELRRRGIRVDEVVALELRHRPAVDVHAVADREPVVSDRGHHARVCLRDGGDVEGVATAGGHGRDGRRRNVRRERDRRERPLGRTKPAQLARRVGRVNERQDVRALHVVDVEQVGRRVRGRDFVDPCRHRIPVGRVRRRVARRRGDAVVVDAAARDEVAERVCGRSVVCSRRSRPERRALRVEPDVLLPQLDDHRLRRAVGERDEARLIGAVLDLGDVLQAGTVLDRSLRQRDEVEELGRTRLELDVVDAPEHLRADLAACERTVVRLRAWHRSAS